MLLLLAFVCFFAMFAIWLTLPNVNESRKSDSVPTGMTATDSPAMPARA